MASPTSPFIDHAAPILAGDPTLSDQQRGDLWDAFHTKNPDELVQHLQAQAIPDETKQALHVAKQASIPAVDPADKIAAVMTKMTQMDPTALALAEAHPTVFKTLAAAANPPDKGAPNASGASKGKSKGDTAGATKKPAALTPDVPATPSGHALVQDSKGGLYHIPHENVGQAKTIDPQLQILHVEP
jgi:hypothetical protein